MRNASWVIIENATGKVMAETWDKTKADLVNAHSKSHKAVGIIEHLSSLSNKGVCK